jgi:hypothetical protein
MRGNDCSRCLVKPNSPAAARESASVIWARAAIVCSMWRADLASWVSGNAWAPKSSDKKQRTSALWLCTLSCRVGGQKIGNGVEDAGSQRQAGTGIGGDIRSDIVRGY